MFYTVLQHLLTVVPLQPFLIVSSLQDEKVRRSVSHWATCISVAVGEVACRCVAVRRPNRSASVVPIDLAV